LRGASFEVWCGLPLLLLVLRLFRLVIYLVLPVLRFLWITSERKGYLTPFSL
jgi:hypothetical protein